MSRGQICRERRLLCVHYAGECQQNHHRKRTQHVGLPERDVRGEYSARSFPEILVQAGDNRNVGCLGRLLSLVGGGHRVASSPPFRRKDHLLTAAERSFLGVLEQAVAGRYRVFTHVRLVDLLWLPKGTPNRQAWLNQVTSKHADFVLVTPDELRPVVVIELDDKSHDRARAIKADATKTAVLAAAGLPLVRIRVQKAYAVEKIRSAVMDAVGEDGRAA